MFLKVLNLLSISSQIIKLLLTFLLNSSTQLNNIHTHNVFKSMKRQLTTLWKELGINQLESLLFDNARGALGLEATVDALDLRLGEASRSAEGLQAVGPVPRGRLQILEFRV